jgi:hypothetical protein
MNGHKHAASPLSFKIRRCLFCILVRSSHARWVLYRWGACCPKKAPMRELRARRARNPFVDEEASHSGGSSGGSGSDSDGDVSGLINGADNSHPFSRARAPPTASASLPL